MLRASTVLRVGFYGGLLLLMAAILLELLDGVLPDGLARRVGFNSEGYTMALIVAAWIEFARPRLVDSRRQWRVTLGVSLVCAAVGIALLWTDLPSRFRTLNEALLAAAVVLPYLQVRRAVPRWVPLAFSGGIFAVIVLFSWTEFVTGLAEMLGVLVLLPLAVDVFDRGILHAGTRQSQRSQSVRYLFYAALVLVPTTLSILERTVDVDGWFGATTRYGVRMHEAFMCVLLVVVYFAIVRALRTRRFPGRDLSLDDLPQRQSV